LTEILLANILNMVQGKKVNDMSNGTPKYQQPNMAFQRGGSAGKNEGRVQNGMP
jgi:hypothetical protein